ncbi:MAG: transglutaminase family protein [Verrucomicrobia bacterium]|nr:transglutaminase family protein [Verrucomicrobiota bacterium]
MKVSAAPPVDTTQDADRQSSVSYTVHHRTVYHYQFPVSLSLHSAHLQPQDSLNQQCRDFQLKIFPIPEHIDVRQDFFGNSTHYFSVEKKHDCLVVDAHSRVEVQAPVLPDPSTVASCAQVIEYLSYAAPDNAETVDIQQYLFPSESIAYSPSAKLFASPYFRDDANFLVACCRLALDIFEEFEFDPTATSVSTPLEKVLEMKKGVCQDFAHLMIACIRACNLPARYVSGYILTSPPDGQERLIGADATHAWVSVFLPKFGWVDIDPTNAQICGTDYVTVATGRDFHDVSPIKGRSSGGGEQKISIAVTMSPDHPKLPEKIPLFL